jgi:hypothetical protein
VEVAAFLAIMRVAMMVLEIQRYVLMENAEQIHVAVIVIALPVKCVQQASVFVQVVRIATEIVLISVIIQVIVECAVRFVIQELV